MNCKTSCGRLLGVGDAQGQVPKMERVVPVAPVGVLIGAGDQVDLLPQVVQQIDLLGDRVGGDIHLHAKKQSEHPGHGGLVPYPSASGGGTRKDLLSGRPQEQDWSCSPVQKMV